MLIANVIARNEEDRYLGPILHHLDEVVDAIVFTDDCSDDNTYSIAEQMGAHVISTDEPIGLDDPLELMLTAWEHLAECASPGDWILNIAPDEVLYGSTILPQLFDQSRYDVIGMTTYYMWNASHYRVDGVWRPGVTPSLYRYYPCTPDFLKHDTVPDYVYEFIRRDRMMWNTPLRLQNLAYATDYDKMTKYRLFQQVPGGMERDHIESIISPNPILVSWS